MAITFEINEFIYTSEKSGMKYNIYEVSGADMIILMDRENHIPSEEHEDIVGYVYFDYHKDLDKPEEYFSALANMESTFESMTAKYEYNLAKTMASHFYSSDDLSTTLDFINKIKAVKSDDKGLKVMACNSFLLFCDKERWSI